MVDIEYIRKQLEDSNINLNADNYSEIEWLKIACDKQIAESLIETESIYGTYYRCPRCKLLLAEIGWSIRYCRNCGQKIKL